MTRAQEIPEGTHGKAANAIAAFLKHDDAASMFYRSYISYKASGRFREAADSLILCANMHEHQRMYLEAARYSQKPASCMLKWTRANV